MPHCHTRNTELSCHYIKTRQSTVNTLFKKNQNASRKIHFRQNPNKATEMVWTPPWNGRYTLTEKRFTSGHRTVGEEEGHNNRERTK